MKLIRAEHLGMCFGVKDAIALATETAKEEPLTILGDLVHNETVLAELRAQDESLAAQAEVLLKARETLNVTGHDAAVPAGPDRRDHGA